jgi:hypothetical protein
MPLRGDARPAARVEVPDARDVEDAAKLTQAERLSGEAKLNLLDEVASRGGPRSAQAAHIARTERLREIQLAVEAKDPVTAIADVGRWFPEWRRDPYVAAQRALANDVTYSACNEELCRYQSAVQADAASTTSERVSRVSASKTALLMALSFSEIKGEPPLARLQRLRSVIALATQPGIATCDDRDLAGKATSAQSWAQNERDKVAFLNADEAIASELLGSSVVDRDTKIATATLEGVGLFLSIDARKKVRGVYLVGPTPGGRQLDGNTDAATRVLSQAMGHPVTIRSPVGTATTSRWTDGATPIVARWKEGRLTELRLGDGSP